MKLCATRRGLLATIAFLLCAASTGYPAAKGLTNIIVILADDLGWTDLSCMGSRFYQTPNLDRLARDGAKFTQAYSACTVCSPTRAALLTGKYPARLRLTDWIPGHRLPNARLSPPKWTPRLPLKETTIAEALTGAGYVCASIGKWHLGGSNVFPQFQGFSTNIGGTGKGQPPSYFAPYKIPTLAEGPEGEYLTDRESDEALRFIESNKDKPFFLYLPHHAVHTPLQAKEELVAKYRARVKPGEPHTNAVYAAMLQSLDESVGRILAKLEELKISDSTAIIFTSDNGGLLRATSNTPLRAGKGSAYEGGVRVPMLVKWPGVSLAGRVIDTPVISMDIFPTVLEIAGVRNSNKVDGVSLTRLLGNADGFPERDIFWHYPHYHPGAARPYTAMRSGKMRFVRFYEDEREELYDLSSDPGEFNNLANERPAESKKLRDKLNSWLKEVNAQMPIPNPNYDAALEPLPDYVIQQDSEGVIVLPGAEAWIHGDTVRYEPQTNKNTIGYWLKAEDWVSWDFAVPRAGKYAVHIWQGCGPGSGGSKVEFSVGEQRLAMTVQETKHFQDFVNREIGTFEFTERGRYRLEVRPKLKPGKAVMDLREVRLIPQR